MKNARMLVLNNCLECPFIADLGGKGYICNSIHKRITVKNGIPDECRLPKVADSWKGVTAKLDVICWAEGMGEALDLIRRGERYKNKEMVKKGKKDFDCCYMFLVGSAKSYRKGVRNKVVFG